MADRRGRCALVLSHACTASQCDLRDPGWGDPEFRHCDEAPTSVSASFALISTTSKILYNDQAKAVALEQKKGFGTVTFFALAPNGLHPCDVCLVSVDSDGWPAWYMADKLPSFHHFSLRSDVDVSMHSTDGFLLFCGFVLLFCGFGFGVFAVLLFFLRCFCFLFVFGLFFQWIMHMASW